MGTRVKNIDIDHKILAKHFNMSIQSFWKLKQRYQQGKKSVWITYVKAYNWDTEIKINSKERIEQ